MKKRILFTCSVCLLSLAAIAQENAQPSHTIPATVLAIPSLKAQAEEIRQKELQLQQSATSSRSVHAQLTEELRTLNEQYKAMLSSQIVLTTNEETRKELEAELVYVQQQLTPATNQR